MSYDTEKLVMGRRPIMVVEMDMDSCPLTYGVAPCTAVLGTTGAQKCFNTRPTCQSSPVLPSGVVAKTYRFVQPHSDIPAGQSWYPFLDGVSLTPTALDIGKGIGQRASAVITLHDAPGSDIGIDPYVSTRAYNPLKQGSFWGKFLARNRFYVGRPLRVLSGYLTKDTSGQTVYDVANFQTRLYFIETIDGPDVNGSVTITAKDVLKFADNNRSQCPVASQGQISADLTAGATTFTVTPAGVGASYAASGVLRIDREVMTFTRAADVFTVVRGQANTTAQTHNANGTVQQCYVVGTVGAYTSPVANDPANIINDLLTNYGHVPAQYIPKADWDTEVANFVTNRYSVVVASPVGVNQLVSELCTQVPLNIWWDERTQLVQLRALRATNGATTLTDRSNFIAGSIKIKDRQDLRVSQCWVYFGQIDPTEILDKPSNYKQLVVEIDVASEIAYGYPAVQRIFSRWLNEFQSAAASNLSNTEIQRYAEAPLQFDFAVDPKDNDLWTGDYITAQCRLAQDFYGAPDPISMQIVNVIESSPGSRFDYSAIEQFFSASSSGTALRSIVINGPTLDFDLRAAHDAIYSAPTGPVNVLCTITSLGLVGASTLLKTAFSVGLWPAGSTITIVNNGRIMGNGGTGGKGGGNAGDFLAKPGTTGGLAFYTRVLITLTNSGLIGGGGGGGGGGSLKLAGGVVYGGGGGGGGQGHAPSTGGLGGVGSPPENLGPPGNSGNDTAPGTGGNPGPGVGSGGLGGGIGLVGHNGQTIDGVVGGLGGQPGNAIDGVSYITFLGPSGDIRGPQIN